MKKTLNLVVPNWNLLVEEAGVGESWPLLPVVDKPLAAHWLDHALDAGFDQVVFWVSHPDVSIEEWVQAATLWPLEVTLETLKGPPGGTCSGMHRLPEMSVVAPTPTTSWDILDRHVEMERTRLERMSPEDRIGTGCSVDPTASLTGPYWLGDYVKIEANAVIEPYTVIGRESLVGSGSRIAGSRLNAGTAVGEGITLVDAWSCPERLINRNKRIVHTQLSADMVQTKASN